MRLSPVGSPRPAWPDDEEYKPALGCWVWNPTLGELRLETNAAIFRQAVAAVWDEAKVAPQAAARVAAGRSASPIASRSRSSRSARRSRASDPNRRLGRARQGAGLVGARANRPAAQGPALWPLPRQPRRSIRRSRSPPRRQDQGQPRPRRQADPDDRSTTSWVAIPFPWK